jgi:hypothetical protein
MTEKNDKVLQTRTLALRLVKDAGQLSRADIAKRLGFTRPTVSVIVAELCEMGLLRATGKGKSCGGKRPIMLELDGENCCAVGIDLGDDLQIRGVLCDLHGKVLREEGLEYENNFASILAVLTRLTLNLTLGIHRKTIKGIGIAVSGTVDTATNEISKSKTFDIHLLVLDNKL